MTGAPPARTPRADARHKRDKLLTAATAAFAEEGEGVALEAVAARAGVGIGTLYRHFPNRDALVAAAYQHEVDALRSAAASDSPLLATTREQIVSALRLLLQAGATSGTSRADVDPKDVMRVMNGIWYLPEGAHWREDVGRMLDLVIDGLRYGAAAARRSQ